MNIDQIMIELRDRYDEGSKYDIQDVQDFLAKHSDRDAEIIYKCVVANHIYKGFPKLPNVKRYLKNDNIDLRTESGSAFFCQICDICHTKFDINMSACPRCRKRTPIKIKASDTPISGVRVGHDDCGYCENYFTSSKGTVCESWGCEEKAGETQYCNGCTCIECCKKEYIRRHDYKKYRMEYMGFKS